MKACSALALLCIIGTSPPAIPCWAADRPSGIIVDATEFPVRGGRYSFVARFQAALQSALDSCGQGMPRVVAEGRKPSGTFDEATIRGLVRASACPPLASLERPPTDGILTRNVWSALMPGAVAPSVDERVSALVLSFEATDFGDAPEWNFCQDSKLPPGGSVDDIVSGARACVNRSDPCSLLTWGPRGATAGAGRELQWILWLTMVRNERLVANAFGSEYAAMRRFLHLKGGGLRACDGTSALEHFVCAIWVDPARRRTWDEALRRLGHSSEAQAAYAEIYASSEFDGSVLRGYFDLWEKLGLQPTEVDYAFFIDRTTHLGGPDDGSEASKPGELKACIEAENSKGAFTANGAARRCLSRQVPHPRQPTDRLARDVAFYIDAYPDGALSKPEIDAWSHFVPLAAQHRLGLSDHQHVRPRAHPSIQQLGPPPPLPRTEALEPGEAEACPTAVLRSLRPEKE